MTVIKMQQKMTYVMILKKTADLNENLSYDG